MRYHREHGSALFYILIAIALLAALSYAVARSERGNVGQLSSEQSRLAATEILQFGDTMASAVGQLRLRGFEVNEISMENDTVTGYTNANCSEDACKVFKVGGGGVTYQKPSTDWTADNWYMTLSSCVQDIGTGGGGTSCDAQGDGTRDLILFLPNITRDICIQINKLVGVNNPSDLPPQDLGPSFTIDNTNKWQGSVVSGTAIGGTAGSQSAYSLNGKAAGCFEALSTPTANSYHFYKVLLAR